VSGNLRVTTIKGFVRLDIPRLGIAGLAAGTWRHAAKRIQASLTLEGKSAPQGKRAGGSPGLSTRWAGEDKRSGSGVRPATRRVCGSPIVPS